MEQYINKDALVAEIERRMNENRGKQTLPQYFGMVEEDLNILSFIDTLEVKEVDLDEISRHYALNNSPWDDCRDEIQDAYKAGFELGLKVKGE